MTTVNSSIVDYSIVVPVYFNEGTLMETMTAIKNDVISKNSNLSCEVIFVDDGSGDGSLNELLLIRKMDPQIVKVIKFTRNFGQISAIFAGFSYARGKCVVVLSADGQDPAFLINEMLNAHLKEEFEVVICAREGREESWYRNLTSKIFYKAMNKLSFPNMPHGGFDFLLMGRQALDTLLRNREANPFFQGQVLWMGFKTKFIKYQRLARKVGQSHWTFNKKLTYLIDGTMSYSFFPIRLISGIGIVFAALGLLYATIIFVLKLFGNIPIKGWAPLMILILVMGGFQMLMLGVIGEYLWRVLAQIRNRDQYIIDTVYDNLRNK